MDVLKDFTPDHGETSQLVRSPSSCCFLLSLATGFSLNGRMWLVFLVALLSPILADSDPTAVTNSTSDMLQGNEAIPGMQDFGAVIRPTRSPNGSCICTQKEVLDQLMQKCQAQVNPLVVKKQAEIDQLKLETKRLMTQKDAEVDQFKKETYAEIDELKKKNDAGNAEADNIKKEIEQIAGKLRLNIDGEFEPSSSKNFSDVWTAINELKQQVKIIQMEAEMRRNKSIKKNTFDGNTILIFGSGGGMTVLNKQRSRWIELPLKVDRSDVAFGAVYLEEEIYLVGGYLYPRRLYKLDKNLKWIRLADMNVGRKHMDNTCLVWNGSIWVFGGQNKDNIAIKSVERYDPKENKWALMDRDMVQRRYKAAAVLWQDKIFISGGFDSGYKDTSTVECYHPNGCQIFLPSMPNTLTRHSHISYNNRILLLSGEYGYRDNACSNVLELDPNEEYPKWKSFMSRGYHTDSFAGVVLDNEIYVIGGRFQGKDVDRVEIFDGEYWRKGPSLPEPISGVPAIIIPQSLADRLVAYKP